VIFNLEPFFHGHQVRFIEPRRSMQRQSRKLSEIAMRFKDQVRVPSNSHFGILSWGATDWIGLHFGNVRIGTELIQTRRGDHHVLIDFAGTEYYRSAKLRPCCSAPKRSGGKVEYVHSMVASTFVTPGHNQVVPLDPEFVLRKHGCTAPALRRMAPVTQRSIRSSRRLSLLTPTDLPACTGERRPFPVRLQTIRVSGHRGVDDHTGR
jgi:hypothetical protein